MTSKYWIGKRPSGGARWVYTDQATVRDDLTDDVFQLYSRYVEQWNRVELDSSRSFAEQTNDLSGARLSIAERGFTLFARTAIKMNWILEVRFAKSFFIYRSGLSFALNAPQKHADIQSIWLHWSGTGDQAFADWLEHQRSLDEA